MRISTWSGNFSASEASKEAHDGSGASRVPRKASVRMETLRCGPLVCKASSIVETNSFSVFPMYKVDRYILFFAPRTFTLRVS